MKRQLLRFLAPVFVALLFATLTMETAQAQYPYSQSRSFGSGRPGFGQSRPAFSPYLNLLRGGNSTLFNYYGLVQPELQFRQADSQLRRNFSRLQYDVRDLQDPRFLYRGSMLRDSGHEAQFFSDLRGGQQSIQETLGARLQLLEGRQSLPTHRPPTGHGAWFGNRGTWYPTPNQTELEPQQ